MISQTWQIDGACWLFVKALWDYNISHIWSSLKRAFTNRSYAKLLKHLTLNRWNVWGRDIFLFNLCHVKSWKCCCEMSYIIRNCVLIQRCSTFKFWYWFIKLFKRISDFIFFNSKNVKFSQTSHFWQFVTSGLANIMCNIITYPHQPSVVNLDYPADHVTDNKTIATPWKMILHNTSLQPILCKSFIKPGLI